MLSRYATVITVIFALSLTLLGQTTQPTTAPTSQPVDQSTPRGAVKFFSTAVQQGDAEAIRAVLYCTNPLEQKLTTAMVNSAVAMADLDRAARKAFPEASGQAAQRDKAIAAEMARIDLAQEQVQGKNATVTIDSQLGPPIRLCLVEGKWMMAVSEIVKGEDPKELDQKLTSQSMETDALKEVALDMSLGKYKSLDEARQAFGQKMIAAQMKQELAAHPAPTTLPTTAPTTQK